MYGDAERPNQEQIQQAAAHGELWAVALLNMDAEEGKRDREAFYAERGFAEVHAEAIPADDPAAETYTLDHLADGQTTLDLNPFFESINDMTRRKLRGFDTSRPRKCGPRYAFLAAAVVKLSDLQADSLTRPDDSRLADLLDRALRSDDFEQTRRSFAIYQQLCRANGVKIFDFERFRHDLALAGMRFGQYRQILARRRQNGPK